MEEGEDGNWMEAKATENQSGVSKQSIVSMKLEETVIASSEAAVTSPVLYWGGTGSRHTRTFAKQQLFSLVS